MIPKINRLILCGVKIGVPWQIIYCDCCYSPTKTCLKLPFVDSTSEIPNNWYYCIEITLQNLDLVIGHVLFNSLVSIEPYVLREYWRHASNCKHHEHEVWYIFDTASNRTHNLFGPKCAPIPKPQWIFNSTVYCIAIEIVYCSLKKLIHSIKSADVCVLWRITRSQHLKFWTSLITSSQCPFKTTKHSQVLCSSSSHRWA